MSGVWRLNWGCGARPEPGWLNADLRTGSGVGLLSDIRQGLPLRSESIHYIHSSHALQELTYQEVGPALSELRRVLLPGGVLRLCLPDFDLAMAAHRARDAAYFYVPDSDARSLSGKLSIQLTWYGTNRLLLNPEFTIELLSRAGFLHTVLARFGRTSSAFPDIARLDTRERESFFIEAER